jgi:prepilin-type N-terminal cleavage/methylation domain-containing protein
MKLRLVVSSVGAPLSEGVFMLSTYYRTRQREGASESEAGFTLIELLIVIVVLGILAAVVVFSLGSVTGNAAKAACQTDVASVNTAEAAYNAQAGTYTALKAQLTGASGYITTWPASSHYTISVIDAGTMAVGDISVAPTVGSPIYYSPTGSAGSVATFALACATVT